MSSGRSRPDEAVESRSGAIAAAPVIRRAPIAATTSTRAATSRSKLAAMASLGAAALAPRATAVGLVRTGAAAQTTLRYGSRVDPGFEQPEWARTRRSLSSRRAADSSSAQARKVTTPSSSRADTRTSLGFVASRRRSITVRRSLSRGTGTVISASISRLAMVEFLMVSAARRSFGITSRVRSSMRMRV
jgi:hypothetical protein